MEEVVAIDERSVKVRNVYSLQVREVGEFDAVVLAYGSASDSTLNDELSAEAPDTHILGDAYAPRRLVFATRQAWWLAKRVVTMAAA